MPLLDSTLAQVGFAFVMIGLFAVILRWTFSKDVSTTPDAFTSNASAGPAEQDPREDSRSAESVYAEIPTSPQPPDPEDYGLLAPATIVDTADEAEQIRTLLGSAGMRATVARGTDGYHRVLVFRRDLDRARRLILRRPADP